MKSIKEVTMNKCHLALVQLLHFKDDPRYAVANLAGHWRVGLKHKFPKSN